MAIFLTGRQPDHRPGHDRLRGRQAHPADARGRRTIVGGVNARKAGEQVDFDGTERCPVFGTVAEAMEDTGADVSVVFVPPTFTKDAVMEAIDAGHAAGRRDHRGRAGARHRRVLCARPETGTTRIIGPNCPGVATPGQSNAGIIPADISGAGRIGLVCKSGTLTYQLMYELRDIGFTTAVGIGGDPIIGTTHIDCSAGVRGRPRHRRDHHGRRDRRRRRGARGGVHQGQRHQAGRRLRRRLHRPRGQDHGPRRRHRLRLHRAPPRPSSRPSRRPASGSARPPARPPG